METPLANRELNQVELSIFSEMLSKRQAKDKSYKRLKCAIYARKSQVDEKDSSLPTQISFCQSVIKSVDFLEETYIFKEDNVSGMNTQNRVEFNKMFELVNNRQIDVIIVYKSDRFSRNAIDAGRYREIARKKDVYVLACDEVIDTTTPTGHFCQTVMWATTELYAREGAERTLLAMSNRAKNGVYVSGKPPIGYTKSSTGKLTIDINESVIVSDIFTKVS